MAYPLYRRLPQRALPVESCAKQETKANTGILDGVAPDHHPRRSGPGAQKRGPVENKPLTQHVSADYRRFVDGSTFLKNDPEYWAALERIRKHGSRALRPRFSNSIAKQVYSHGVYYQGTIVLDHPYATKAGPAPV